MNLVFYVLVLLLHFARGDWDLAVLTSSTLELLEQGNFETPLNSHHLGVKEITELTYDPLLLHHYFAANGHKNATIFRVQVSRDGRMGPVEPLVKKQPGKVLGLAFDAESTSVFWTSSSKIFRSQLDLGLTDAQVVHSFDNEIPTAIEVEPCSRYIYWSYHHGAIDRSLMDGSKIERVVNGLFLPMALYISQAERMIYWVDIGPGESYSIGRALLDGSNKETVVMDFHQQPTSLVVRSLGPHNSVIYWTDSVTMKLWSFNKNNDTSPVAVHSFGQPIYGVTTSNSFDHLDKHVCSKLISMRDEVPYSAINPTAAGCVHGTYSSRSNSCVCTPGYRGELCETSICFNYCLMGSCSMSNGKPHCRCPPGITGLRCELDRCRGYCFHGGCSVEENDSLSCACHPGWYGPRCNYSEQYCAYACQAGISEQDFCSCNVTLSAAALTASSGSKIDYKIGFIISAATCGVMFLCLIGLVVKTWKLGKRPRVKRFYKVTPNKGSAPQAVRTSPDCQIAIENCCNMNICETPCYEPELRPSGGKSKKEEKRGLLKEMEVQPDLGKTF